MRPMKDRQVDKARAVNVELASGTSGRYRGPNIGESICFAWFKSSHLGEDRGVLREHRCSLGEHSGDVGRTPLFSQRTPR